MSRSDSWSGTPLKTLSTDAGGAIVKTDADGRLWVVIGTDSGFEGTTEIYYLNGTITLTPI
jgi:hypothetical protein